MKPLTKLRRALLKKIKDPGSSVKQIKTTIINFILRG